MSRVYFHSREATIGIGGRERHSFGWLSWRLTEALLDIGPNDAFLAEKLGRYREMLRPGHYAAGEPDERFARMLMTAMHVDTPLRWNGHTIDTFAMALNTAHVVGSDAVKLAARVHGQCEIHGWVDGPHRAWLAGIIERGLRGGVFHSAIGQPPHEWPDVIALLRSSDVGEVFMSYSVCEQFPSLSAAREVEATLEHERWYELDAEERWEVARAGVRARGPGHELHPDRWQDYWFRPRLSAIDLASDGWRSRLDEAYPRESDGGASAGTSS